MKILRNSVGRYFIVFTFSFIIILSTVFRLVSTSALRQTQEAEQQKHLATMARELVYVYEMYAKQSGRATFYTNEGKLYLGSEKVEDMPALIDRMKEMSGLEFTLFVGSKRELTTIMDETGKRYVNTYNVLVWENYISNGKPYYANDIEIGNKQYCGYYIPIRSAEGFIIGMSFAGVPMKELNTRVSELSKNMTLIATAACVVAAIVILLLVHRLTRRQKVITTYMEEIDRGEFNHEMPEWITKRGDEYGTMGRILVNMNESLAGKVQRDNLTGLYNRGAAMVQLKKCFVEANTHDGAPFTFVIGDIDFFKKVNDTYGHNCGDEVLKKVAEILKREVKPYGFAARWGGEEFILVFKEKIGPAQKHLESIADIIRNTTVHYDDFDVKVTMTFGMVQYHAPNNLDYVITKADQMLYKGKENGRNQIVS